MKDHVKTTKRAWSSQEDERLRGLVEYYGPSKWTVVADHMGGRTGKQCRERWHNHLDPAVKKGEWTPEEDRIIIEMQAKLGNQWAKITRMLPGRTDNAVKNRWHSSMRNKNKAIRDQAMSIPLPNAARLQEIVREEESPRPMKAKAPRTSTGAKVEEDAFPMHMAPSTPEAAPLTPQSARGRKLKRSSRSSPLASKKRAAPGEKASDLSSSRLSVKPEDPLADPEVVRSVHSYFSSDDTTDESDDDFAFMALLDESEAPIKASPASTKASVQLSAPPASTAAAAHGAAASAMAARFPVPAITIFPEPFLGGEHEVVAPRDLSPVGSLASGLNDWLDECFFLDDPVNLLQQDTSDDSSLSTQEDADVFRPIDIPEDFEDLGSVSLGRKRSQGARAMEPARKRRRFPNPAVEPPSEENAPSANFVSNGTDKHLQQQLARLRMAGFHRPSSPMVNVFANDARFPQQSFFAGVLGH